MRGMTSVFFFFFSGTDREDPPVVLDEHQSDADDGRAVFDAHCVRTHITTSFLLEQVRSEDHGQVSSCHFVSRNLTMNTRWQVKIQFRKLNTFIKICLYASDFIQKV